MGTDRSDWCTEGAVKGYRIVRKLKGGPKVDSYLVVDSKGQKVVLTVADRGRMLERYRFKAHREGADAAALEEEARAAVDRWMEEYRQMVKRIKSLGSDHVATTYGFGADQERDTITVVSEYVPGVDFQYATKGLKPVQTVSLFVQVLEGLAFIHQQGFLHLNVKPSRIRADVEGIPFVVKFTDFGFAVPRRGYEGDYHGTALYMAPEVILSQRDVIDERADLYSFAMMAYACLTDRYPTEHRLEAGGNRQTLASCVAREGVFSPPSHYNKEIPPELDRIVMGLLDKDPGKRLWNEAAILINEFFTCWPKESREMPHESTSTLFDYE